MVYSNLLKICVVVVRPWHLYVVVVRSLYPCVVGVVVVVRPCHSMCGCGCGCGQTLAPMCGCGWGCGHALAPMCGCCCGCGQTFAPMCGCGCGCGQALAPMCGCGCGCGQTLAPMCGCGCGCGFWQFGLDMCDCVKNSICSQLGDAGRRVKYSICNLPGIVTSDAGRRMQ